MDKAKQSLSYRRSRAVFSYVLIIWVVILGRLFYLQVIKHDYYAKLATQTQERQFVVEAERGIISVLDRDESRQLVLNENLPTIFADPRFIDDKKATAIQLAEIIGGKVSDYQDLLDVDSAYVVVKRRAPLSLANKIMDAEIKGVGTIDTYYRSYPEGSLASQTLGFVNSDGDGQYGIEEYLDATLAGEDGLVDAITDVTGVPLRADERNILKDAIDGEDITLTLDINIQKRVEELLKSKMKESRATGGAVIVMDPNTGAVKAMANYPTFEPTKFGEVTDYSVFLNSVVNEPYEVGSVFKAFTMAAGINEGVIGRNTTYLNTGSVKVDDRTIKNALQFGYNRTTTMDEVIQNSLNTGAVFVLKQLGGGEINAESRGVLYDYFTEKFRFGWLSGIEQVYEEQGIIYGPSEGSGLNVRYANMSFGQGMTATMLQTTAALASVVNGGTYFKPYLLHSQTDGQGVETLTKPITIASKVVKESTTKHIKDMLELVVKGGGGATARVNGYKIGGKTGTAQIPLPGGGYSTETEIGSFAGYIEGGDGLEYVIMTRIDEPRGYLYAGSGVAAPLFGDVARYLIDYDRIPPLD